MINVINEIPLTQVDKLYNPGETLLKIKVHVIIHMNIDFLDLI